MFLCEESELVVFWEELEQLMDVGLVVGEGGFL